MSMLLYKDEAFEDRWTTVPSLTLDDDIFVKVFMVNGLIKGTMFTTQDVLARTKAMTMTLAFAG